MLHSKRGSLPQMQLQANRLESGSIPTALQWKKATVFALANPALDDFLSWLKDVPEGLEQIHTATFSDNARPELNLYVLLGWSTSGADELRRAAVDSVIASGSQINIYVSRPHVEANFGLMGTADMRFVGWEISLDNWLKAGQRYKALLHVRRDTIKISAKPPYREEVVSGQGYEKVGEIELKTSGTG